MSIIDDSKALLDKQINSLVKENKAITSDFLNSEIIQDIGLQNINLEKELSNNALTQNNDNLNSIENNENIFEISENIGNELCLQEITKMRKNDINKPQISYLNVNSLRNKIHAIRDLTSKLIPTVLAISETKIDNSFPDSQFLIDGYQNPNNFRKDRTNNGGGLITFIKKGVPCRRISKMEPPDLEVICIDIDFGKKKWALISVYRQATKHTPRVWKNEWRK